MNKGERDELIIKLKLVKLRDSGSFFMGRRIQSVGFGNSEYLPLPSESPENLAILND